MEEDFFLLVVESKRRQRKLPQNSTSLFRFHKRKKKNCSEVSINNGISCTGSGKGSFQIRNNELLLPLSFVSTSFGSRAGRNKDSISNQSNKQKRRQRYTRSHDVWFSCTCDIIVQFTSIAIVLVRMEWPFRWVLCRKFVGVQADLKTVETKEPGEHQIPFDKTKSLKTILSMKENLYHPCTNMVS